MKIYLITFNPMLKTFADKHAKLLYSEPEYILDKIEIEQRILDIKETKDFIKALAQKENHNTQNLRI